MKRLIMLLSVMVFVLSLAVTAGEKKKFGNDLTVKQMTKISDILANPLKYDGKKVKVTGAVVGVCEKRGCWIRISSDKEFESIRFKVDDGVIIFPMEIKGDNVVAEGIVSVTTVTKEQQIEQGEKHAKEEGETFDPSTVTGPKTTIQLKGEGAVVTKK